MQRYAQVAKRETADADRCGVAERKSLIPKGMSYRIRDQVQVTAHRVRYIT